MVLTKKQHVVSMHSNYSMNEEILVRYWKCDRKLSSGNVWSILTPRYWSFEFFLKIPTPDSGLLKLDSKLRLWQKPQCPDFNTSASSLRILM